MYHRVCIIQTELLGDRDDDDSDDTPYYTPINWIIYAYNCPVGLGILALSNDVEEYTSLLKGHES